MEHNPTRLHPLIMIAAIAVTLFSLAGIGVITGLIPTRQSEAPPSPAAAVPPPTVPAPAASVATAPVPEAPAAIVPAPPKPKAAPIRRLATPAPVARRDPPASSNGMPPPPPGSSLAASAPQPPVAPPVCHDCGTVQDVRQVVLQGEGTGAGAAMGGILGGVLGHQVGSGRGNDAATVLGAIGGAVAGHQIEKSQRKSVRYEITVRMDDGAQRTVTTQNPPAWRGGERVRLVNGTLTDLM